MEAIRRSSSTNKTFISLPSLGLRLILRQPRVKALRTGGVHGQNPGDRYQHVPLPRPLQAQRNEAVVCPTLDNAEVAGGHVRWPWPGRFPILFPRTSTLSSVYFNPEQEARTMRICGSRVATGLALVLSTVLALPGLLRGQTASYLDYEGFTRELRSVVNGSDLANMESLGTTLEGREVWMVQVANPAGTPLDERPAVLVVGNLEGDHLVGSQLSLEAIRYLVAHASDEAVRTVLAEHVFYFFPRLNPDGAEAMFAAVKWDRRTNTRPFDDDNDGRVDEDGPEDLNGDGYVTVMRVADPSGAYMIDPADERLMKRADPTKGETGAYTLYFEGTDNDGDGFINEDGPGGVDLNRNFQHEYPYWQADAGPYMVSEVETRALMDFVIAHRNIGAILTFGETDNLVTPPDSRGALASAKVLDLPVFAQASNADVFSVGCFAAGGGFGGRRIRRLRRPRRRRGVPAGSPAGSATTIRAPEPGRPRRWPTQDQVYFTTVSDAYKRITGIENVPVHRTPEGAFFQYGYFQYGVPSFTTPGWGAARAGSARGEWRCERSGAPAAAAGGRGPASGRMPAGSMMAAGGGGMAGPQTAPWPGGSGATPDPLCHGAAGVEAFADWTPFQHPTWGTWRSVGSCPTSRRTHRPSSFRSWARSRASSWWSWRACCPGSASRTPR